MILTKRDKEISRYIEDYGSITINQCAKVFYKGNKEPYYQARKRLKILSNSGYLKRYRQDMKSECVYYFTKCLGIHDLKVLDVYAELISLGAEITFFKQEYTVAYGDKKYICDGLIELKYNGYFYPLLIEVDYTHFTSERKLTDIYCSNHFQERYKEFDDNLFPSVLIIRPYVNNNLIQTDLYNLFYFDFNLHNLNNVLA